MSEMKTVTIGGVTYTVHDPDALSGTDTTLSVPNKAADAAAVGKALAQPKLNRYTFAVTGAGASYQQIVDNWDSIPDKTPFVAYCDGDYTQGAGGGVAIGYRFNWGYGCFLYMTYLLAGGGYMQLVSYSNGTVRIYEIGGSAQ